MDQMAAMISGASKVRPACAAKSTEAVPAVKCGNQNYVLIDAVGGGLLVDQGQRESMDSTMHHT